jgi:hypothetical protein
MGHLLYWRKSAADSNTCSFDADFSSVFSFFWRKKVGSNLKSFVAAYYRVEAEVCIRGIQIIIHSVGSMKNPSASNGSSGWRPPHTSVAPSAFADASPARAASAWPPDGRLGGACIGATHAGIPVATSGEVYFYGADVNAVPSRWCNRTPHAVGAYFS